jgi:hypothetical protein
MQASVITNVMGSPGGLAKGKRDPSTIRWTVRNQVKRDF